MKITLTVISTFILLFLGMSYAVAQPRGISGSVNPGVVSKQLSTQAQQQRQQQQIRDRQRQQTIKYRKQNAY